MPTHNTHIHLQPDDNITTWTIPVDGDRVCLQLFDGLQLFGSRQQLTDLLRAGLTALYADPATEEVPRALYDALHGDSPTEPAIPDTDPEPAPVTPLPVPGLSVVPDEDDDPGPFIVNGRVWEFGPTQVEVGPDAS